MRAAVLLVLLLVPLAAASIGDVQLLVGQEPLTHVNYGSTIDVTLEFEKTPGASMVQIESPQMRTGKRVITTECNTCRTSVSITTEQYLTFEFTEDVDGNIVSTTKTISVDVDSSKPEITDVRIGECTSGCAWGPNQRTISLRIADDRALNPDTLSITANGEDLEPSCQQTLQDYTCQANITGAGDQDLAISVTDGAGNTNTRTIAARYDDIPPRIASEPSFVLYGDQIPALKASKLLVDVEEPEGARIRVESDIFNGSAPCSREGRGLTCVLDVVPEKPWSGTLTITITDKAGNAAEERMAVTVLEASEEQPDFWDVKAEPLLRLNPRTFVMERYYPVDLELVRKTATPSSARPVAIELQNCRLAGVGSGGLTHEPIAPARKTQIAFTIGNPDQAALQNADHEIYRGNLTCKTRIWTRVGNVLYQEPEEDDLTFKPLFNGLSELTPRDMLEAERTQMIARIDRQERSLVTAERSIQGLQMMCGTSKYINTAAGALNGAAGIASLIPGGQGAAGALDISSTQLGEAYKRLESAVRPVCFLVTCDLWQAGADAGLSKLGGMDSSIGSVAGVASDIGEVAGITSVGDFLSPYQSRYAALATACLPAYYYHERVSLNTDCQYTQCLQEFGSTGLSPDECAYERQYQECRQEARSQYFIMPQNVLKDTLLAQAEVLLDNPLSLVGIAASSYCWASGTTEMNIACKAVGFADDLAKLNGGIQLIKDNIDYFERTQTGGDVCQGALAAARQFETPLPYSMSNDYCNVGFTHTTYRGREYFWIGGEIYTTGEAEAAQLSFDRARMDSASAMIGTSVRPAGELPGHVKNAVEQAARGCSADMDPDALDAAARAHLQASQAKEAYNQARETYHHSISELEEARSTNPLLKAPEGAKRGEWNDLVERHRDLCENGCENANTAAMNELTSDIQTYLITSGACNLGHPTTPGLECQLAALNRLDALNKDREAVDTINQQKATMEGQERAFKQRMQDAGEELERYRLAQLRGEYSHWSSGARRTIRAGMAWAAIPKTIGAITGWNPLAGVWGDINPFPDRNAEVEEYINNQCSDLSGAPSSVAYQDPVGQPAAKISAWREKTPDDSYLYGLNVYLNARGEHDGEPSIILLGAGSPYRVDTINMHEAQYTTAFQNERRYTRACIEMPEPLTTYFSAVRGDSQQKRLCADIVEVRT